MVALARVSFAAEDHSWTYVIGPTASGKTTLLRAIAGLEPLAGGEILIGGRVATDRRVAIAPHLRSVGFLFQEPSLWPHLTAAANVALGVAGRERTQKARIREARRWLDRLGVIGLADSFPAQMSGGEARWVALGRALASQPSILLLDEPTAHLDLHLRGAMMEGLHRVHRELETTTLCVTHQIEPPMRRDDRVIILEAGSVIFDGALWALGQAPETPFTRALRRSLDGWEKWVP